MTGSLSTERPIPGVSLIRIPTINDSRGNLSFAYFDQHLPFVPVRFFVIHGVPQGERRGEHAHRMTSQFILCLGGHCTVALDNGRDKCEIQLDSPDCGISVEPKIWNEVRNMSPGANLVVFASEPYDRGEYISDYEEFRSIALQS